MHSRSRDVWVVIALLIAFLAPPIALESPLNHALSADPAVIVVGDFSDEFAFGSLVYGGVNGAVVLFPEEFTLLQHSMVEPSLADAVTGDPQAAERLLTLRRAIIHDIAEENVIAIISANTSNTAPAIIELGRTFSVPVLLTVATNDRLLADAGQVASRLLPRDELQAGAVAKWCVSPNSMHTEGSPEQPAGESPSQPARRVGVVYDPRQYGQDLQRQIREASGPLNVMGFSLLSAAGAAGILSEGTSLGVDRWIVLAYSDQAADFYSKKRAIGAVGSVLLSDGTFGPWLHHSLDDTNLVMSIPKRPINDVPDGISADATWLSGLTIYGTYGFDAMRIVGETLRRGRREGIRKNAFGGMLREMATTLGRSRRTFHTYSFTGEGENSDADFEVVNVANVVDISIRKGN